MRRSRTAKQRVWLGPGRYLSRCREPLTHTDAESYAITNGVTCSMRALGNTNTYAYANDHTDRYTGHVQLVGGAEHAYSIG